MISSSIARPFSALAGPQEELPLQDFQLGRHERLARGCRPQRFQGGVGFVGGLP